MPDLALGPMSFSLDFNLIQNSNDKLYSGCSFQMHIADLSDDLSQIFHCFYSRNLILFHLEDCSLIVNVIFLMSGAEV